MSLGIALHAVGVRRGRKWVLRDITLDLARGGRWALIGENGAGKTQLLKLIAGDLWPTPTGRERRCYHDRGGEIDLSEAKSRISYLGAELQDKYTRYGWDLTVRELLATGVHRTDLLLTQVTRAERRIVESALSNCGLVRLASRRLSTLSYGQKRVALLARALCQRSDWLLLDELYNGLDAHYRARIDRILRSPVMHRRSWIVSAHRESDVPRGTGGIIELARGRLTSIRKLTRTALARLRVAAREIRTAAGKDAGMAAKPRRPRAASGAPIIELSGADLYVEYRRVLREVSWKLYEGEHWAILGANGAGKSSFLKLLYGDLAPALGGTVERRGFPKGSHIADWKRQIGYVSPELQTHYAVDVTVQDLVVSGRYASIGLADAPTAADLRSAARWLRFFKLSSAAARRPRELSYGQLRRALIARALAAQPRILLLDEPLTGLDPRQRALIKQLLERLMQARLAIVIAVHHPEDLPRGITHELRLANGRATAVDRHSAN
jgi:molybdate transport system ATP-binding protein